MERAPGRAGSVAGSGGGGGDLGSGRGEHAGQGVGQRRRAGYDGGKVILSMAFRMSSTISISDRCLSSIFAFPPLPLRCVWGRYVSYSSSNCTNPKNENNHPCMPTFHVSRPSIHS